MKRRHAIRSILLIILLNTLASTRSYAGWQPFKKPLGNNGLGITIRTPLGRNGVAKAVDEEEKKSVAAVNAEPTQDAALRKAKQEIADAAEAVKFQATESNKFLLAAASFLLTNTFTVVGLVISWRTRHLEVRRLLIEIEERELALKELKRKLAGDDPNITI